MNRNMFYNYLKGIEELKPLFYKEGKGYIIKFVPNCWVRFTQVIINSWYVENFYSIILTVSEVIIEGETDDLQIHIKYKDIDNIDVQLEEGYKYKK